MEMCMCNMDIITVLQYSNLNFPGGTSLRINKVFFTNHQSKFLVAL